MHLRGINAQSLVSVGRGKGGNNIWETKDEVMLDFNLFSTSVVFIYIFFLKYLKAVLG